jgi:hypothetical protein
MWFAAKLARRPIEASCCRQFFSPGNAHKELQMDTERGHTLKTKLMHTRAGTFSDAGKPREWGCSVKTLRRLLSARKQPIGSCTTTK